MVSFQASEGTSLGTKIRVLKLTDLSVQFFPYYFPLTASRGLSVGFLPYSSSVGGIFRRLAIRCQVNFSFAHLEVPGLYRSQREQRPFEEELEVRSAIEQIAVEHCRRYGYRRISAELRRPGMRVNPF